MKLIIATLLIFSTTNAYACYLSTGCDKTIVVQPSGGPKTNPDGTRSF